MTSVTEPKRIYIIFPVWVALNYVLVRTTPNIAQIQPVQIVRPLLVVGAVAALFTLLLCRLFKDAPRAGVLSACCLYFFLYYGYISDFLRQLPWMTSESARGILILFLWVTLAVLVTRRALWQRLKEPANLINFLNVTLLALMLAPGYYIVSFLITSSGTLEVIQNQQSAIPSLQLDAEIERPDIYYIILDGYARADILEEVFSFDNTEMIAFLEDRGFYVAAAARSNYIHTILSLPSSLNMDYLNEWVAPMSRSANRWPLIALLQNNRVQIILKSLGYTTVSVSSVVESDIAGADVRFPFFGDSLNTFERFLLSRTAAQWIVKIFAIESPWPGYAAHRAGILYSFEQLSQIPETIPGPKFVFAHILAPHPPFVMDRNGDLIEPNYTYFIGDGSGYPGTLEEYLQRYPDEIVYVNILLKKTVDDILNRSPTPPIIILQADHGSGALLYFEAPEKSCLRERFSIFNAYYLPGENAPRLYDSITPVNSFRLIFDAYFGANLGLLEDKNYFSAWDYFCTFTDVTDQLATPCTVPQR